MSPSEILDQDVTPDGDPVELTLEDGHYVVRISGLGLMSSAMYGSEQAMAKIAAERIGKKASARVLVGGLGMGFTLRAALDCFGKKSQITVAELLPAIVRYNLGVLGPCAGHPLSDSRVTLFEGDVRDAVTTGTWDAILMDVDNGPEAFTVPGNANLYTHAGIRAFVARLAPGGVLVIWSAFASGAFVRYIEELGLEVESRKARPRTAAKGPRHTLFLISSPPSP